MGLSPQRRIAIYSGFIEALEQSIHETLTQEHTRELMEKRGLYPQTIKEARICSGTKKRVETATSRMLDNFSTDELDEAGITHQGNPSLRWMEDDDAPKGKLIIPYLSPDGRQVIYLRCHKRGPAGVELEVYGQHILAKNPEDIVITEGEYKALALTQSRIPALAVPGISSFAGKHYDKLEQLLVQHKIKKATILFDNEVKDDPAFSSFKDDPMKRWDTDYYAIRMANKLYRSIKSGLIARLPDEWRINGKIDPDGALAHGKSPEALQKVIRSATIPLNYHEQLPYEARVVVGYKLERDRLHNSKLQEQRGVYTWKESQDEIKTLSNFLLHPKRQTRRADGTLERVYQAVSRQGEEAEIVLTPAEFTQNQSFKRNLLNTGNFHWSGSQRHLEILAERLFVLASPKVAEEAERFGRQEDNRWVFGDGLIDKDKSYPLGEDGVVWGRSLSGVIPLQDDRCPVPRFVLAEREAPDLVDLYETFKASQGLESVGLALGWVLGCVWADEIFAQVGSYPILGLFGPAGSGKTAFGEHMVSGWGMPRHSQNPIRLETSTAKGVERTLAKFASMPVWADEYRNDLYTRTIHMLRSIYDRSSGVMAEYSADNRTRGADIRGCLVLSGEEYPSDPALMSRIISIDFSKEYRDVEAFKVTQQKAETFKFLVKDVLGRSEELWPKVWSCIAATKQRLQPKAGDERLAWLYATPLGVFSALLSHEPSSSNREGKVLGELISWTEKELQRLILLRKEDDHLGRFWTAVFILACDYQQGRSILNREHIGLSRDGGELLVSFTQCFAKYEEFEKRVGHKVPFNRDTLRAYFKQAPYVIKVDAPRKLGGRSSVRCIQVDLKHGECPQEIRELAERASGVDWDVQRFLDIYAAEEDEWKKDEAEQDDPNGRLFQ